MISRKPVENPLFQRLKTDTDFSEKLCAVKESEMQDKYLDLT